MSLRVGPIESNHGIDARPRLRLARAGLERLRIEAVEAPWRDLLGQGHLEHLATEAPPQTAEDRVGRGSQRSRLLPRLARTASIHRRACPRGMTRCRRS